MAAQAPQREASSASASATTAYTVAGLCKYFAVRDVGTVRIERSDNYAFVNDLITFRGLLRTDAKQLVNRTNSAVKWLRNPLQAWGLSTAISFLRSRVDRP